MSQFAIVTSDGLIRRTVSSKSGINLAAGESWRDLTDQEYTQICTSRSTGKASWVIAGVVTEETSDLRDDRRDPKDFLRRKVSALSLAERLTAYPKLSAVIAAIDAADKNGSKAQVDTITELSAAARTKAKNIIERTL